MVSDHDRNCAEAQGVLEQTTGPGEEPVLQGGGEICQRNRSHGRISSS